jgi:hypothetical protein
MSRVFPSPAAQYEPFLFAIMCDEMNGMPLTLVSAIARTGVDPWAEAVRIASMPRDRAREALTALIPERPGVADQQSEAWAIADRLIALLPRRGAREGGGSAPEVKISAVARRRRPSNATLTAVAVCLGLALAIVALNHSQRKETLSGTLGGVANQGATDQPISK